MTFGSKCWGSWLSEESTALPLIKYAYNRGINTWDTADVYSNGLTEKILAKAIKQYNIPRNRLVICTKVFFATTNDQEDGEDAMPFIEEMCDNSEPLVNRVGLSRKHIFDAVQASMKRLGDTYIDVLYIHRLDTGTPAREIMEALNDVVRAGWVRYIAASSMPCWQFQHLQSIAEREGWAKFIAMQHYHHLLYREEERETMPYCKFSGVGLVPWSALSRGLLARPWSESGGKQPQSQREKDDIYIDVLIRRRETESDKAIVDRVQELALKKGVSMPCVATAWSLKQGCTPMTGANTMERLDEALEALEFEMSDDEARFLEAPYLPKVPFQFT